MKRPDGDAGIGRSLPDLPPVDVRHDGGRLRKLHEANARRGVVLKGLRGDGIRAAAV